jgi:predicted NAD/FAD-dependent oxidoreductase
LDVHEWKKHIRRHPRQRKLKVAVIGAGVSGAFCARILQENVCEVVAFDKGRGPGGRLSTRSRKANSFDHGTSQFELNHPLLERFKRRWQEAGAIALWQGRRIEISDGGSMDLDTSAELWVGQPTMSGFVEHLLKGVNVQFEKRAVKVSDAGVEFDDGQRFECDMSVIALPAPQSADVLSEDHHFVPLLKRVEFEPCWTLMATMESTIVPDFVQARFANDEVISKVFRNQTKHNTGQSERWTLHATPAWSKQHLELSKEQAAALMSDALERAFSTHELKVLEASAHRWRFSRVAKAIGTPSLVHDNIGLCGDSVLGDGVENALLSGAAMAGRVMSREYTGVKKASN